MRTSDLVHFEAEVKALQTLGHHPNLVSLLATFQYKNSLFLLFPWADGGNLLDFYKVGLSQPILFKGILVWFFDQCLGLAEALRIIHNTEIPLPVPKDDLSSVARSSKPSEANMIFGRHGDIKPQNVLWFPSASSELDDPTNSVLKLSDFGLTNFHRLDSRSNIPAHTVEGSMTYEAPEVVVGTRVSRKYDIWSLACTFLEFASWLLLGPTGFEAFCDARELEGDDGIVEDRYFEVRRSEPSGVGIAAVKPGVSKVRLASRY